MSRTRTRVRAKDLNASSTRSQRHVNVSSALRGVRCRHRSGMAKGERDEVAHESGKEVPSDDPGRTRTHQARRRAVVLLAQGQEAADVEIARTVVRSRQVEYLAAEEVTSYWSCSVATSQRPNVCRFQPVEGFVREKVWTTASSYVGSSIW